MKILRSKDLKEYRERLKSQQGNIDPILSEHMTKVCLDHDHKTGHCRSALDYNSNQFLGKIETARKRYLYKFKDSDIPDILRRAADYLERDFTTRPLHPKYISILIRRYSNLTKIKQLEIFKAKGETSAERTKEYRKHLMKEENIYEI